MSVKYQDYYQTLGVPRGASQEEIQRAYRRLARELHPDVNKSPGAEQRFRDVAEAYEVLKDPERRKRYDQLGADWKSGQDFTPPPGWENIRFDFGTAGAGRARRPGRSGRARGAAPFEDVFGAGGFSDFFEAIFGGGARAGEPFAGVRGGRATQEEAADLPREGPTHEAQITISLDDAYRGGTRRITLRRGDNGAGQARTYDVRIPPGITDGATIRLAGQGGPGHAGGPPGDLLLRVSIAPDPRFSVSGHDLACVLPIAPWEAALGAKVPVPTLDGEVTLTVPPGSQSGQRLRLRGKGLPKRQGGERGDQYVELKIVVPKQLSDAERAAFESLRAASNFDPRRA
jgi:curved DNA-binding protein